MTTDTWQTPDIHAAVHALLLRLAGHLPDPLVAGARIDLAAGRRADAVRAVAGAVLTQAVPLDPDEIELLRADPEIDADLADALPDLRGLRPPAPWLFVSAFPEQPDEATLLVRPLDLTGAAGAGLDPVDRAVLADLVAVPGVTAVWRSWRMPPPAPRWRDPVRVVVVSVDERVDDLPALTARIQGVLTDVGAATAQAEVCWAGLEVPIYQMLARSCGALLWADAPAVPVRVASAFDGVDPERGPWFRPDRPLIGAGETKDALLAALAAGEIVIRSDTSMTDVVDPRRGAVVPLDLRTDGRWIWSDATSYHLEHHDVAPDPELTRHLLATPGPAPLDEVGLHRALVHLLARETTDVAWQPPPTAPTAPPVPPAPIATEDPS